MSIADDKMANISLDVHTFIAENLPKYRLQYSLDYTFLSLKALHTIGKVSVNASKNQEISNKTNL